MNLLYPFEDQPRCEIQNLAGEMQKRRRPLLSGNVEVEGLRKVKHVLSSRCCGWVLWPKKSARSVCEGRDERG